MRKILFTESQMKRILESEGIEDGYLNIVSTGTETPENISGTQVTVDPVNFEDEPTHKVTGDEVSNMKNMPYGFRRSYVREDIEQQNYRYGQRQKENIAQSGSKMASNIVNDKNGKTVSNGTQRKRKHDLELKKKELSPEEFQRLYGGIEKTVKSSLNQMSNVNNVLTNNSDISKLSQSNDVTKIKTKTSKGHHKDGEEIGNNGTLHYFN